MIEAIRRFCERTEQVPPEGPVETTRCILESLALSYRQAIETLGTLTRQRFRVLHVVGGGSQNELLCQLAADATGLPVTAGPVEATAAGNVLVQALARGVLRSPEEIREVVRRSTELRQYPPRSTGSLESQYRKYQRVVNSHS